MAEQRQQVDPDTPLMHGIAAGDVRALDALYARHGAALLSFLIARLGDRQSAEEVLQDTMMAAWREAHNFRHESSIRTWLFVIARNRATNLQRKHRPTLTLLDEALSGGDTGPLEKVEKLEAQDKVRAALHHLPAPQREVLLLVFYQQMTPTEVAQVLGISDGTVKSRLYRAKEMLRRVLQQRGL
ncbi:MAG: RNA polymerase sigma factor [Chloroflexi bacterium]|nr:RNA polymerase sigma factor [Chloroflexota bacterium]